jgi:hypothetical protein
MKNTKTVIYGPATVSPTDKDIVIFKSGKTFKFKDGYRSENTEMIQLKDSNVKEIKWNYDDNPGYLGEAEILMDLDTGVLYWCY